MNKQLSEFKFEKSTFSMKSSSILKKLNLETCNTLQIHQKTTKNNLNRQHDMTVQYSKNNFCTITHIVKQ